MELLGWCYQFCLSIRRSVCNAKVLWSYRLGNLGYLEWKVITQIGLRIRSSGPHHQVSSPRGTSPNFATVAVICSVRHETFLADSRSYCRTIVL